MIAKTKDEFLIGEKEHLIGKRYAEIDEAAMAGYRAEETASTPKRFLHDPLLRDAWNIGKRRAKEDRRLHTE
jgi:hypothetical protein